METITIDIINNKAIKLLQDLELLQLIRMHREKKEIASTNGVARYKGAMTRQPLADVERQLKELRSEWE